MQQCRPFLRPRPLHPAAIGELQDQRTVVEVLKRYARVVQPPIEGVQPGVRDNFFRSGGQGEFRLQNSRDRLNVNRALLGEGAENDAHGVPSLGRVVATDRQMIATSG
jgi:hypothetical protein